MWYPSSCFSSNTTHATQFTFRIITIHHLIVNSIIYLDGQILIKLQFSVKLYGRQRLISVLHLCPISRLMSAISVVTLPRPVVYKLVTSKITFLILGRVSFVYDRVCKLALLKPVDSSFRTILLLRISLTTWYCRK